MSQPTLPIRRRGSRKRGPLPWRQLWQVPTFAIGLLALLAVAISRPLWSQGDEQRLDRCLAAARAELDRENPDGDHVVAQAESGLKLVDPVSPLAAEAHFLIGSGHVCRAQQAPAELADDIWRQARYHLEQAETLGLEPRDQLRHHYRLGKTYFALNLSPDKVIEYLTPSVGADNTFEAYGLLARSYLRLQPPEPRKALEAVKRQLSLPTIDEASLAAPRLLCGELYHQLDEPEEARKMLQRIGAGAPPAILFQARYQLARLLQDEGEWQEAATLWEQVKSDPHAAQGEPGRVWYDLGLCYRHLDRLDAATAAWEQAMTFAGAEAQAAGLGVAEMRLHGDNPGLAVDAFETALARVNRADEYTNALVDLAEARRRMEAGCRILLEAGLYAQSARLAKSYEKIAAAGLASLWAGKAVEAWAQQQRLAALRLDGAAKDALDLEARQLFRQAAQAYLRTADHAADPEIRAQALWQSAMCFQFGQDHAQTIATLERFVQLPIAPARRGQAWFVIGETQQALNNEFAAQSAFRKCIEFPGPQAFQARYQLAMAELGKNQLDEAEAMLSQNLELMGATSPAREKTLYALAGLYFMKKDYRMTMVRYQEALERYPKNPDALKGRLQFAQSCRALAEQASQRLVGDVASVAERDHYRKIRADFLDKAAQAFQVVDEHLARLPQLSPEEQAQARHAAFALAECRFDLGQYDEALKMYEVLGVRYHHQIEGLVALRSAWQCHGVKLRHEQARAALERIRVTLREMPSTAFDESADIHSRRWWENWVLERINLADNRSGR